MNLILNVISYHSIGSVNIMKTPTLKDAQGIADTLFAEFVGEDVDKVEMVYQRFVSLIASKPVTQTLLPLSRQGEICDVEGNCIDPGMIYCDSCSCQVLVCFWAVFFVPWAIWVVDC